MEGEEQQRSAVQVGDPFMEKLLLEACLELILEHSDSLIGIQDMGQPVSFLPVLKWLQKLVQD